jgi:hypothetical protein
MSESQSAGADASVSTQPTASESVVNENNLPGEHTIEQGVDEAVEMAETAATEQKEQEAAAKKSAEEIVEDALEDFAELWKTKKGKEILKVNGKKREIQDYNDMVRLAQLGLAANEKFQQASDKIRQAEAIVELLQTNPEKALQRLGFDVRQMAEEYLRAELQKEVLTDEQRKIMEMEQKLAEYEEQKKKKEDEEKANRISELQRHYEAELSDKIIKAIETYKLPRNERTISRIAEKLYVALENGYEIDPLDVAPLVKQEVEEELRGMYGTLDVDSMLQLLGEDNLKKIREHELRKVKDKAPKNPVKTTPVATPRQESETGSKKIKAADFFKNLEEKYK